MPLKKGHRLYESARMEAKGEMTRAFRCVEEWLATTGLPATDTEAEYELAV